MNEEATWLTTTILELASESPSYPQKAFYFALAELAKEQSKRIEQAKGELDGRIWSPKAW